MAWTKAQTAVVVGIGILLAAGATTITIREVQAHKRYPWQVPNVSYKMVRQFPPQTVIVPTIFEHESFAIDGIQGGGAIGMCVSITNIVRIADIEDIYRMVFGPELPTNRYDFFARGANTDWGQWRMALQQELKSKLGIVEKPEVRNADVLLLEYKNPNAGGLKPPDSLRRIMNEPANMRETLGTNSITYFLSPISNLKDNLQGLLEIPVIDQTGIKGLHDFQLVWDEQDRVRHNENLKRAVYDDLGIELVRTNMPFEMVVVEKAH